MVDALERLLVLGGDAEARLGEVALDRLQPVRAVAGGLAQPLELVLGALADQDVDVAFALEQPLDEMTADEAGCPGHEVAHAGTLPRAQRTLTRTRLE